MIARRGVVLTISLLAAVLLGACGGPGASQSPSGSAQAPQASPSASGDTQASESAPEASGSASEEASDVMSSGDPTLSPAPSGDAYVVKSGDTMTSIAKAHGITLKQLVEANPQVSDPDQLAVGDELVIPSPEAAPSASASSS